MNQAHTSPARSCLACQCLSLYRVCVTSEDDGTERTTDVTFHGPHADTPTAEGMRLVLAAEALERAYGVLYDFAPDDDEGAAIVTVIGGSLLFVTAQPDDVPNPHRFAPLWSGKRVQ